MNDDQIMETFYIIPKVPNVIDGSQVDNKKAQIRKAMTDISHSRNSFIVYCLANQYKACGFWYDTYLHRDS